MPLALTDRFQTATWLVWASSIALVLGVSGCAGVFRPEEMPVASVEGVVTEGRRPVGGGWIEFIPAAGTIGKLRSARLDADGSFKTTGVAVGVNIIRIANARIESPVVARVVGEFASPIRRTVSSSDRRSISIDVLDETLRFQASLSPRSGARGPAAAKGTP
jgi:hypothetical protein